MNMDNHIYTHTRSSEELRDANVTNVNVTPPNVVPRLPRVSTGLGRGALLSSMLEHDMIATPVDSPSIKKTSQSGARCDTPAFHGENYGFEQSDQPNQWQTMADLMKQLGSEIGNQIAASLSSAGQNVQRDNLSAQHPSAQPNLSNLNLVIRHQDIKEPPTFRGDKTDRCTIGEWEELMQTYLNKKGYSVSEQGQEILDRLMGRAKDVVRTCIRNNSLINVNRDPHVLFSILRQHFGDAVSSTTPLRDFYETIPRRSECGLDYWIRLNKAVDLADECLRRQGKKVEDPSHEVTMMFVRHCPEPTLYAALRSKPLESWTANEVQALIDSHHRDKQSSGVERALQAEEKPSGAWCMTQQQAPDSGQASGFDPALLSRAVSLLEQMILSQKEKEKEPRAEQVKTLQGESSRYSNSCGVCRALDHTTKTHCFKEGLCFVCYKTGHRGFECPKRKPEKQGTTRRYSGPDHPLN